MSTLGAGETSSDARGCSQIVPEIGITSTPVIDLRWVRTEPCIWSRCPRTLANNYHQRLHALDISTGAEQFNGPVEITATYAGNGAEGSGGMQRFAASQHEDRPALLIANGIVYTTWGSHCDAAPYTGWVIGYNESTLAQTGVLNLTPNGNDGGIWMAGGGPAADASGNLYLLMGNGTFDTTLAARIPRARRLWQRLREDSGLFDRRAFRRRLFHHVEHYQRIERRSGSGFRRHHAGARLRLRSARARTRTFTSSSKTTWASSIRTPTPIFKL